MKGGFLSSPISLANVSLFLSWVSIWLLWKFLRHSTGLLLVSFSQKSSVSDPGF